MVVFYLIRHGESTDNVKGIWAGSRDADLTQHGKLQAEALADHLSSVTLNAIHSSDLKRAAVTAAEIKKKQPHADVQHHISALLREQDFGSGEGRKFSKAQKGLSITQHHAKGLFPAIHTRHQKFPGGECLDDVEERAVRVVEEILMEHVMKENEEGKGRVVAVVSHGIFIGELVRVVLKRDSRSVEDVDARDVRGMRNTAWTKMEVKLAIVDPQAQASGPNMRPSLVTKITDHNHYPHLARLQPRQRGGLGSLPYDPDQKDIRNFFCGASGEKKPVSKIGSKVTRAKPYSR